MGNLILALVGGLAGGLLLGGLMRPQGQMPAPQQMLAPPQQAGTPSNQDPNYQQMLGRNRRAAASGPMAGPSSTFLTGAAGVDPNSLSLGQNTLLGS